MALVLADRVQENTTTSGTGPVTLAGAVFGFQTFAVIGNGNTCYYAIVDGGAWEVGIGTYSTTGPALARTTILSNSNGNTSPITLSGGTSSVFVTYPSGKSVNVDASTGVTLPGALTVAGTINTGSNAVVGGTLSGNQFFPTSSSGAQINSLRDGVVTVNVGTTGSIAKTFTFDINGNLSVNRLNQANTNTAAAGGTTTLTAASTYSQTLTGTGNQTFAMPDATTLTTGVAFVFNNNATGTLTLTNYAAATIGTITPGGAVELVLLANGTVGGTWDVHGFLPENVTWGTNALALGSTVITGGTWNGGTVQPPYGGTGLTTFTAANNALYSTGASTLTAGTLPIAAGGTGNTTATTAFNALAPSQTSNSGKYLTTDGTNSSWATVVSLSNDTSTATNIYPLSAAATSGAASTLYTSNAKFLYKPSTGELQASEIAASNGLILNATTVSASYTIASGYNAFSVGPVTIGAGISVTISSGQRWLVQ
jgi:hypothetical protein